MSDRWYFFKGELFFGPFSLEQLRQMAQLGEIGPDTRLQFGTHLMDASAVLNVFAPPKPTGAVASLGDESADQRMQPAPFDLATASILQHAEPVTDQPLADTPPPRSPSDRPHVKTTGQKGRSPEVDLFDSNPEIEMGEPDIPHPSRKVSAAPKTETQSNRNTTLDEPVYRMTWTGRIRWLRIAWRTGSISRTRAVLAIGAVTIGAILVGVALNIWGLSSSTNALSHMTVQQFSEQIVGRRFLRQNFFRQFGSPNRGEDHGQDLVFVFQCYDGEAHVLLPAEPWTTAEEIHPKACAKH